MGMRESLNFKILIIRNNEMFLCSAVPVRGCAQCALQTKSVLQFLNNSPRAKGIFLC